MCVNTTFWRSLVVFGKRPGSVPGVGVPGSPKSTLSVVGSVLPTHSYPDILKTSNGAPRLWAGPVGPSASAAGVRAGWWPIEFMAQVRLGAQEAINQSAGGLCAECSRCSRRSPSQLYLLNLLPSRNGSFHHLNPITFREERTARVWPRNP